MNIWATRGFKHLLNDFERYPSQVLNLYHFHIESEEEHPWKERIVDFFNEFSTSPWSNTKRLLFPRNATHIKNRKELTPTIDNTFPKLHISRLMTAQERFLIFIFWISIIWKSTYITSRSFYLFSFSYIFHFLHVRSCLYETL